MTADYEAVFNDIMGYAKKNIGERPIETKEDLIAYIKESDRQKTISSKLIREMLETQSANSYVDNEALKAAAIKKELSRSQQARNADESKTAKKVEKISQESFKKWKRNPSRFDLKGIDTKTHQLIRDEIRLRVKKALDQGYTVRRRGNLYFRLEKNNKRARDLITGKFVKVKL